MFLISNFRRVLYVVRFLLGNSLASEFYMPTFRNTYLPMEMEQTERSETSAYKIQTPETYPEENIPQEYSCLQASKIFSMAMSFPSNVSVMSYIHFSFTFSSWLYIPGRIFLVRMSLLCIRTWNVHQLLFIILSYPITGNYTARM